MTPTELAPYPVELHPAMKSASKQWADAEYSINYSRRVLLYGPPGTGKTRAASQWARGEQPLVRMYITTETTAAELRGHWLIGPHGAEMVRGHCMEAWHMDARAVIDEIDQAGGDAIPFLHAFLDDAETASVTMPDGSTMKPGDNFSCVATTNHDPNTAIPEALRDRFVVRRHIQYAKPTILETLPTQIRVAAALALYGTRDSVPFPILRSTRTWVELGHLMSKKMLPLTNALRVIGIDAGHITKVAGLVMEASHA